MKHKNIVNANHLVTKRKKKITEIIFSILLFLVMLGRVVTNMGR